MFIMNLSIKVYLTFVDNSIMRTQTLQLEHENTYISKVEVL